MLVAGLILPAQAEPDPPIRVFAASSLIEAIPLIERAWTAAGGAPLAVTFDASSRLATQIAQGAPADLFLSADRAWADWLEDEGSDQLQPGTVFAVNRLVVVTRSADAPGARVRTARPPPPRDLESLKRTPLSMALAGENVPAGRYAEEALRNAGAWEAMAPRVVRGGSVLSVVEWVRRGEVDLGIAYRTDVRRSADLELLFELDPGLHAPIEYVAVATREASPATHEFLAFLTRPSTQRQLAAIGFADTPVAESTVTAQAEAGATPRRPVDNPASAIRLSLFVALLSTLLAAVPAVGLGWLLARRDFRGKALVSTAVLAPLVLPPVVTGYLMLSFLGREGLGGRLLGLLGVQVPFTLLGAVLAATVVGLPLFVLAARAAFEGVDRRYEEVAASLGDPPLRTFFRVALPLARSGILAGAVLAFARALGEFGATIVLAGNLQGATRTIPLAVYTLMEAPGEGRAIWVLVGASILLSLGALVMYETLSRSQRSGGR